MRELLSFFYGKNMKQVTSMNLTREQLIKLKDPTPLKELSFEDRCFIYSRHISSISRIYIDVSKICRSVRIPNQTNYLFK